MFSPDPAVKGKLPAGEVFAVSKSPLLRCEESRCLSLAQTDPNRVGEYAKVQARPAGGNGTQGEMKTILKVIAFVAILTALSAILTLGAIILLGDLATGTQHPSTTLFILSVGAAILAYGFLKAGEALTSRMMRKIGEKGLPTELPESERKTIQFWTGATLAAILVLVVLLRVIHHV